MIKVLNVMVLMLISTIIGIIIIGSAVTTVIRYYIIAMILSHPLGFAKQLAAGRSGCLGS